jgi:SAM-dependent methyltransferase
MKRAVDKHWERFGKDDAYFGVVTSDEFKRENLNEQAKTKFFQSGEDHIDFIVRLIKQHLDANFCPKRSLDFGCGTGRLVALRNCQAYNVEFIESDDEMSKVGGKFDFVHSFIVFQHISVRRGLKLFERMIELLSDNGVAALHFTYFRDVSFMRKSLCWMQKKIPLMSNLANLVKGKPFSNPHMQMNDYNLNRIFELLQKWGLDKVYLHFTNHDGHLGLILFFQKKLM